MPADAPSAATGAMAEEEEEVEDDGKTVALAKGGLTNLARIAGRTSLAREAGEISLVRIARTATQAFLSAATSKEERRPTSRRGGWGLPGAARNHLHLGWRAGPSLTAHLQAVCSRGECSPPQA